MNKRLLVLTLLAIVLLGCSSKRKLKEIDNSETIRKDYIVRDASSNYRPAWIEDVNLWVEQEGKSDRYRYFAFETEPKVNREIACNLAKANARTDIAAEITTFIQKKLASSQSGQAAIDPNNPKTRPMRSFVENTLAEKVQAMVRGSSIMSRYWEKRNYLIKQGAKKNYFGYTCAVLVRVGDKQLKEAIKKASEEVVKSSDDPEVKESVKEALKNIDQDFDKARLGEV